MCSIATVATQERKFVDKNGNDNDLTATATTITPIRHPCAAEIVSRKPFDCCYSCGHNPDGTRWDDHLYFSLVRGRRRTLVVESNEIAAAAALADGQDSKNSMDGELNQLNQPNPSTTSTSQLKSTLDNNASFWYETFPISPKSKRKLTRDVLKEQADKKMSDNNSKFL